MKNLLLLSLLACSGALRPEEPVWNKQPCDHCKMLLSDQRYAASLVDARGVRLFFDDIGCMAAFEADHPQLKAHWVKDEQSGAWLDPSTAFFRDGAKTPMDYGYSGHKEGPGISYAQLQQTLSVGKRTEHAHHH